MRIEIMDTTLRDGEQTSGLAFTDGEKLNIARLLLDELKVDRIEIASARVSEGEFTAVEKIIKWATGKGCLHKIEVLGFVDNNRSIDWIVRAGAKVLNLLCKGSMKHLKGQLRKTPEEHIRDVKQAVRYAKSKGLDVNLYLEDWSNGMKNSPEYVHLLLENLKEEPISRFMLPDTLGILNHEETFVYCDEMVQSFPGLHFDFHAHNDYDLAAANVYSAIKAGFKGIHTTVNGLGERAGNVPLSSVVAILNDQLHGECNIVENKINKISKLVESFSGIRIPSNKPIIGEYVFTQTCGVHADGDNKENLYFNKLMPDRFGREREYALGKTAGKANIEMNLLELGIELDEDSMRKVTERVIQLGDRKEHVTREDLPFIISDVLKSQTFENRIKIKNYALTVADNLRPMAAVKLDVNGAIYQESASGDGQYDAFMKAVKKIYQNLGKNLPTLVDYMVTIPPGGMADALVGTVITWQGKKVFRTRGVDSDQTIAAVTATIKMLNFIENHPDYA